MWKFTKLHKAEATDPKKNEGIGIKFIAQFENGTEIETLGTTVDSKEMMEKTLRNLEKRLDQRDADLESIDTTTYELPPEPVQEKPEPTPEEKEEQALAEAEAELHATYEAEKRMVDIEAMAETNQKLKAKLDAVKALKVKKEEKVKLKK